MTSGDIMTQGYGNRQETLFLQYLSQFKLAKGAGSGGRLPKNHTMARGGHIDGQPLTHYLIIAEC